VEESGFEVGFGGRICHGESFGFEAGEEIEAVFGVECGVERHGALSEKFKMTSSPALLLKKEKGDLLMEIGGKVLRFLD